MFLAATSQYSHIKNQFISFNTDQKSIRKSKKVSFSSKNAVLTPNLPSITRGIRSEFSFFHENYFLFDVLIDFVYVLNEIN